MAPRAQMYSLHTRKRRLSKSSSGRQVSPRRLENSVSCAVCVFKERVMRLSYISVGGCGTADILCETAVCCLVIA
jgi:hypothetical protein